MCWWRVFRQVNESYGYFRMAYYHQCVSGECSGRLIKFALRVASWVLVSGGKFNVEFMGNVNNDRVAGAEIFPPLANKQN